MALVCSLVPGIVQRRASNGADSERTGSEIGSTLLYRSKIAA